jgi:hypothetical protein
MYEMVKHIVSSIHLFMNPDEKRGFLSPLVGFTRQTTRFNLISSVLSVKWLTSILGVRLNWVVLPHDGTLQIIRDL